MFLGKKICEVTFVDNQIYRNDANHHGFIYQNPNYANPSAETYQRNHNDCERFENFKLATIYIKPQAYNGINSPAEALKQGTAFAELYSPFVGKGGHR